MSETKIELKPCKRCGAMPRLTSQRRNRRSSRCNWGYICSNGDCNASYFCITYEDVETAAKKWNEKNEKEKPKNAKLYGELP